VRNCQRDPEQRVCAQVVFVRRAVEFNQLFVNRRLIQRVPSFERRRDLLVNVGHRFLNTFATEPILVPVAQFPCFMFARARSARYRRASKYTAFKAHINFNGRIAA
jgi:hypothetical protein